MAHSISTVAALLGKTSLFGPLEHAHRMEVARQMVKAAFAPNQIVFTRGDAGGDVYLVLEGRVRLSVFSTDGRLLSFKHANPGDIFGEIAALDRGSRTADAIALTGVEARSLAQEQLDRLIGSYPQVARAAIAMLCQRLRDTSEQVEAIALHQVEVRLARYLLARLKPSGTGTAAVGFKASVDLGMSQNELASLIGASRQKVNAALRKLERAGAISRSGRRLVCDVSKLAEIAAAS